MKKLIYLFLFIGTLTGCQNEELKKENAKLKAELDSTKTFNKKEEEKRNFFGLYEKKDGTGYYGSFDFKGETTVMVSGLFVCGYVRDGKILRIHTDQSDLMLTIKDDKTLIGEGFADGTYVKKE